MEGQAEGFVSMLETCFAELDDPRNENSCDHLLIDMIAITILGVTCGADDWTDLETFGKGRQQWLETFLELPKGIPSHDTFRRVFGLLDPKQFSVGLFEWTQAIQEATGGKLIAINIKSSVISTTDCPADSTTSAVAYSGLSTVFQTRSM